MSKRFNFQRAHREWAQPQFDKLPPVIKHLYARVEKMAEQLHQDATLGVPFPTTGDGSTLRAQFERVPSEALAKAQFVIYYWGHWGHTSAVTVHYPGLPPRTFQATGDVLSPNTEAKDWVEQLNSYGAPDGEVRYEYHQAGPTDKQGAYWKFQKLAKAVVLTRGEGVLLEEHVLKKLLDWPGTPDTWGQAWMDHEPGTKYEQNELHELMNPIIAEDGLFEVVEVRSVNFKPHPFCIGQRHMTAAQHHGGILGEAACRAAPCAMHGCDLPYEAHTHDTVALVRALRDMTNPEAAACLSKLKPFCEEHSIDGFGFLKTEFTIAKPEESDDAVADPAV